ncbi:hypothetical protein [Pseudochrobactrum kiredjianiae]|uniref:Uncharacterized protein n=1 Tax=Pseudochrobactrum kiredjianiae TaxID=386305 RepID=A0ABW3V5F2_9HYPH|nr:hypothetical protein [Pseudochrobactrum kiredjianiae]MDM7849888.1 hypothetical protein [Pseudochrobactrum kiredjianiae]
MNDTSISFTRKRLASFTHKRLASFTRKQLTSLTRKQLAGFKKTPQQNGAIINVFWGNNQGSFYAKALKHRLSGNGNLSGFRDSA